MNFFTECVHAGKLNGGKANFDNTGAISVPIYQSSTFEHPGVGKSTGFDYSRVQNPTRDYAERAVALLEKGYGACGFSTGMAAILAVSELFDTGDEIIASDDLYGGTIRLFSALLSRRKIMVHFVDTNDESEIKNKINSRTKAIFVETPTNPLLHVTDLKMVVNVAQKNNLAIIVDNTFLTPFYQKPLEFGTDIVVHSGTKYLGGHNDVLAGFVVCRERSFFDKIQYISKTIGACLSPFDAFLIVRGLKTLAIRMEKCSENALKIAQFLAKNNKVEKVYFLGLETHPDFELSKRQTSGFGGMVSFTVDSAETARNILEKTRIIAFAESLGGVETLVTYPITQTHAEVPRDILEKNGINECFLRLSVGIEDADDLICDLREAFS